MNSMLSSYLEVIWSDADVETVLNAHEKLISVATKENLPELISALKSDRNDFWTRELISEPIAYLGVVEYLSELLYALEKNTSEGHDSDTLAYLIVEIAELEPDACRAKLEALKHESPSIHSKYSDWLLEFCTEQENQSI